MRPAHSELSGWAMKGDIRYQGRPDQVTLAHAGNNRKKAAANHRRHARHVGVGLCRHLHGGRSGVDAGQPRGDRGAARRDQRIAGPGPAAVAAVPDLHGPGGAR
ncbi:hypothetical protein G6F57_022758 [Rhizopus arrhizus]|nr:hypothetical protein G6F57_022758 [Rhizopus arrhizus]